MSFSRWCRHLSTKTKPCNLSKIPSKYRHQTIHQAQKALTDYLHTTRALPFLYAELITKNATHSLSSLISKLDCFSAPAFSRMFQKFLRYHPINEFEFFYESIGIHYCEISCFLKPHVFFFSEDMTALNAACALSGFGFPWNMLGKLYKEDVSIFMKKPDFLAHRLDILKSMGFGNVDVIGICLAFPCVLSADDGELSSEIGALLDDLKRVFIEFDFRSRIEGNVDAWYEACRKTKVFYDLGIEKGIAGELIGKRQNLFLEYEEKVLTEKAEFFCRLDVRKRDVGLLLLESPEILSIDLENPVISVFGFLKHFGMEEVELNSIAGKYSYVMGQNRMCNLPYVLRSMDLHEWFFDKMNSGKWRSLLSSYALSIPDEGVDEDYIRGVEKIKCTRTPKHTFNKLKFLHSIGFGENSTTMKILANMHGSSSDLQERFDCLLHAGIGFSKLCKMISISPKILNQDASILKQKLNFLCHELGLSLDYLDAFPAYLLFDLEKRIKPRYKFHQWLVEKGLCDRKYSLASMIATSEKSFLARISGINSTLVDHWLQHFTFRDDDGNCQEASVF